MAEAVLAWEPGRHLLPTGVAGQTEIWTPVRGYRGFYEVSNLGRVWSVKRTRVWRDGRVRTVGGYELKHNVNDDGYRYVSLYRNGKRKQVRVNRLVARHYVANPRRKPEVNHKDLDKGNNRAGNLEWMTRKENVEHYCGTVPQATWDDIPL